jgi:DNA-binding MarR family transcriptional regulator
MRPYYVNMVDSHGGRDLRSSIELFYFAYRAFTSPPDRILAQRGLGRVHHRILYFVGRHPGLTVNELRETLAVSKQALHAPLRKLLQSGLIVAAPGEEDRRARHLSLTRAGRGLEERLTRTQTAHLQAAFGAAGATAVRCWHEVMTNLRQP